VPQSLILFLWLSTIDQFNFGLQKEYITWAILCQILTLQDYEGCYRLAHSPEMNGSIPTLTKACSVYADKEEKPKIISPDSPKKKQTNKNQRTQTSMAVGEQTRNINQHQHKKSLNSEEKVSQRRPGRQERWRAGLHPLLNLGQHRNRPPRTCGGEPSGGHRRSMTFSRCRADALLWDVLLQHLLPPDTATLAVPSSSICSPLALCVVTLATATISFGYVLLAAWKFWRRQLGGWSRGRRMERGGADIFTERDLGYWQLGRHQQQNPVTQRRNIAVSNLLSCTHTVMNGRTYFRSE
jgi:hypothetical protein